MVDAGTIRFDAAGLITAVAQDAHTGEVLMVAHMNREALERTLATRQGWYWSRSRRRLWRKGEESGHVQRVVDVRIDCDGDVVLLRVDQVGSACHTGHRSCFYRGLTQGSPAGIKVVEPVPAAVDPGAADLEARAGSAGTEAPTRSGVPEILNELGAVLADRRERPRQGSYSAQLFAEGLARLNEKIMEEAAEVTRAARKETPERLVEETADLWFHTLALLVFQGIDPGRVYAELARRRR